MSKSIYSLVLNDRVVEELDRLAYRQGTSRSALINRILADYVSYQTPEMRLRQVMDSAVSALDTVEALQLMLQPAGSSMALRSALRYKYNPTVKYSVELNKTAGAEVGLLKVSLRSQSSSLLYYFGAFCSLWHRLEGIPDSCWEEGRFQRPLRVRAALPGELLGREIVQYVACFDSALKDYFALLDQPEAAASAVVRRLAAYNGCFKE